MLPPLCAVATSQSTVSNTQTQSGAVSSTQALNVVDVSGANTVTTTATGNAVSGAVESGALDVESTQSLSGAINAGAQLNVTTNAGPQTVMTTAATGNSGDVGSYEGGALTGAVNQSITAAGTVTAGSQFNAYSAQAGDVSTTTQAIGNTHGIGVSDASAAMTVNQTNSANITANGDALLQYTPGTGSFTATAVSNNVTSAGTGAASQTLTVSQTADGMTVTELDANAGNAQTISGAATSTANNLSVTNENNGLTVVANQSNTGYAQAQAQVSGYQFGTGQAAAYGVDNSVLAGNYGSSLSLDNTQSNTATGLEVRAAFTGGASGETNYDASASATAMGNAATGYACSACNANIAVTNSQSNSATIGATTEVDIAGANRSVTATATAAGNSATFYVSKPTQ